MKKATFNNGSRADRNIIIKISDDFIYFYFEREYFRHIEWVATKEEDEIEEDEKEPCEFYGFEKQRWKHPQENFPSHMMRKNWFTQDMLDFINKNCI